MDETTYWLMAPDGSRYGPGTLEQIARWAREGRVPRDSFIVPYGEDAAQPRRVMDVPELAQIVNAPPTVAGDLSQPALHQSDTDATGGLIPYKNAHALAGYYTAVASILCGVGAFSGPIAIILGVMGLRNSKRNPKVRGIAHAWVAIILGAACTIANWAAIIWIFLKRF